MLKLPDNENCCKLRFAIICGNPACSRGFGSDVLCAFGIEKEPIILWHWNWKRPQVHAHGLASTFPFPAYQTLHPCWKNAEQSPTLQVENTQICPPLLVGFHNVGGREWSVTLCCSRRCSTPSFTSCSKLFILFSIVSVLANKFWIISLDSFN